MSYIRGCIWFIRQFGLRRLIRYERARHRVTIIDYAEVFTPEELVKLEAMGIHPWKN